MCTVGGSNLSGPTMNKTYSIANMYWIEESADTHWRVSFPYQFLNKTSREGWSIETVAQVTGEVLSWDWTPPSNWCMLSTDSD